MNSQDILRNLGISVDIQLDSSETYDYEIAGFDNDYDPKLLDFTNSIVFDTPILNNLTNDDPTIENIKLCEFDNRINDVNYIYSGLTVSFNYDEFTDHFNILDSEGNIIHDYENFILNNDLFTYTGITNEIHYFVICEYSDTPVPTSSPTPEPTNTETPTPTETSTPLPSATSTETPLPTSTIQPTPNPTLEPTPNPTLEPTPNPTVEPTPNPTGTSTPIPTIEPTPNPTSTEGPTSTPNPTSTLQPTPNPTSTEAPTPTPNPTSTNQPTPVPTNTAVPTATPVPTSTIQPTPLPTSTEEPTATPAPTSTLQPTPLPTSTNQPTPNPTVEPTPQPTLGPTPNPTVEPTPNPTSTEIPTPIPTSTQAPTPTPNPTSTNQPTPNPTSTIPPTLTPNPTSTNQPTPNPTSTIPPTLTPNPTSTNQPTPEPTSTNQPTSTPDATPNPTPEPTSTNQPTSTPDATPNPTPVPTSTETPTPTPNPTEYTTTLNVSTVQKFTPSLSGLTLWYAEVEESYVNNQNQYDTTLNWIEVGTFNPIGDCSQGSGPSNTLSIALSGDHLSFIYTLIHFRDSNGTVIYGSRMSSLCNYTWQNEYHKKSASQILNTNPSYNLQFSIYSNTLSIVPPTPTPTDTPIPTATETPVPTSTLQPTPTVDVSSFKLHVYNQTTNFTITNFKLSNQYNQISNTLSFDSSGTHIVNPNSEAHHSYATLDTTNFKWFRINIPATGNGVYYGWYYLNGSFAGLGWQYAFSSLIDLRVGPGGQHHYYTLGPNDVVDLYLTDTDTPPVAEPTSTPQPTASSTPEPTPTESSTPQPTSTPNATPQPTASSTPEPTPTESSTPQPTSTPNATPQPTSTPNATPQPTAIPLSCLTPITSVQAVGGQYQFNGSYGIYGINLGTYEIQGVPSSHPIAFLNNGKESMVSYSGQNNAGTKVGSDGNTYTYYYGDVTLTISDNFGVISYDCYYHGYMGGQNNLNYSVSCTSPQPTTTPNPTPLPTSTPDPTPVPTGTNTPTPLPTSTPLMSQAWIPTPDAWFDASDTSSYTLSGSNLTSVTDKAGNFNMLVDGTPTRMSNGLNNKNVWDFNGNESLISSNSGPYASGGNHWAIGVFQFHTTTSTRDSFWSADGGKTYALSSGNSSNNWYGEIDYDGSNSIVNGVAKNVFTQRINQSQWAIVAVIANKTDNEFYGRLNGGIKTNVDVYNNSMDTNCSDLRMMRNRSGVKLDGRMAEYFHYSSYVGGDTNNYNEVWKAEGYLAHKWGLQGLLPSNHPYRHNAPTL